ncbi:MAG: lipid II flippase MurJ, partial [Rhodospirillales bacterium]
RGHLTLDARFKSRFLRTVVAVFGMGGALWGGLMALDIPVLGSELTRITGLLALVVGGGLVFAVLAAVTGAARPSDIKGLLSRGGERHS